MFTSPVLYKVTQGMTRDVWLEYDVQLKLWGVSLSPSVSSWDVLVVLNTFMQIIHQNLL